MPPHATSSASLPGLDPREIARFEENGFVGPFSVCSPAEMAEFRGRLSPYLARHARRNPDSQGTDPPSPKLLFDGHLDNRTIHDLVFRSAIVERLASLLGPDLLLWRTAFWVKDPGSAAVYWHQDVVPEEGRQAMSNVSCWMAIDDVTEGNGCVQLIKGSHRQTEAELDLANEDRRGRYFAESELRPPEGVEPERIVPMPLRAGEFFLFDQLTVHGSDCNRSDTERIGLAIRVIPPHARTKLENPCVVLRGEDRHGFHEIAPARPSWLRRARRELARLLR